ncbi:hypothetical protein WDV76_15115 [Xenorhabdus griffiniae]|uniref:hypothetical protein n=1 Tax=Xenorhabdus griffiniae TaxID=351672 RepID=UPI0030CC7785
MNITPIGILALQYCHKQLPLTVLQTRAGFYIGTIEGGVPCSRESMEYFARRERGCRKSSCYLLRSALFL